MTTDLGEKMQEIMESMSKEEFSKELQKAIVSEFTKNHTKWWYDCLVQIRKIEGKLEDMSDSSNMTIE